MREGERRTRVLVEITWDPDLTEHPSEWDFESMMRRDPFTYGGEKVRVISFDDVDESPEQA